MPQAGDLILASDTGQVATAWVPVLTATTTNPTLGTGSSASGIWWREGRLVYAMARIAWGTAGVNPGVGDYRITLPTAASGSLNGSGGLGDGSPIGNATLRDASGPGSSTGATAQLANANQALLLSAAGAVGGSNPWAWAISDRINCMFIYPID